MTLLAREKKTPPLTKSPYQLGIKNLPADVVMDVRKSERRAAKQARLAWKLSPAGEELSMKELVPRLERLFEDCVELTNDIFGTKEFKEHLNHQRAELEAMLSEALDTEDTDFIRESLSEYCVREGSAGLGMLMDFARHASKSQSCAVIEFLGILDQPYSKQQRTRFLLELLRRPESSIRMSAALALISLGASVDSERLQEIRELEKNPIVSDALDALLRQVEATARCQS